MMNKYTIKLLPPVMNTLYVQNRDVHNHYTRQKHLLHINKSNINVYAYIFSSTSAHVWNVFQTEINISTFKNISKQYLKNNALTLRLFFVRAQFNNIPRLGRSLTTYPGHSYKSNVKLVQHYWTVCKESCFKYLMLPTSVVCLPRPMEGMGRLQFSDIFFTELSVPPQAVRVVGTF